MHAVRNMQRSIIERYSDDQCRIIVSFVSVTFAGFTVTSCRTKAGMQWSDLVKNEAERCYR